MDNGLEEEGPLSALPAGWSLKGLRATTHPMLACWLFITGSLEADHCRQAALSSAHQDSLLSSQYHGTEQRVAKLNQSAPNPSQQNNLERSGVFDNSKLHYSNYIRTLTISPANV